MVLSLMDLRPFRFLRKSMYSLSLEKVTPYQGGTSNFSGTVGTKQYEFPVSSSCGATTPLCARMVTN